MKKGTHHALSTAFYRYYPVRGGEGGVRILTWPFLVSKLVMPRFEWIRNVPIVISHDFQLPYMLYASVDCRNLPQQGLSIMSYKIGSCFFRTLGRAWKHLKTKLQDEANAHQAFASKVTEGRRYFHGISITFV